jgi:hypothetical protein
MHGRDEKYKIFVRKPERKTPVRRLKYVWEDIIKILIDRCKSVDWIYLVQDRDQDHWCTPLSTVMELNAP